MITCCGALWSSELTLWPMHPHSWPNECRLMSLWSCRLWSLSINTPQMPIISTNVSSSSPPIHLAKAHGHPLSSYFQLFFRFFWFWVLFIFNYVLLVTIQIILSF